jgi:hypothetical protein
MDTQVVVKESLSAEMIDAGNELVQQLDKIKFVVHAALWLYLPEANNWRLIIANPEVDSHGPKRAYRKIQNALARMSQELPKVALRDITVVDTNDPLISLMRTVISTGNEISGIRFSHNVIHGTLIEDAYIYRMMQNLKHNAVKHNRMTA